jgi:NAD(P)-dependent dehydrogenase (short-subunit alcohol dehydrogenase family)
MSALSYTRFDALIRIQKYMKSKVWFVSGASKGLGAVLAQELLSRGYRVAATSRSRAELTRVLGEPSGSFLPLEVDLVDEASVRAAVGKTLEHFGSLDVVVNNAGYGQLGTVEETTDQEARRNFDVNVFGVLNVLRATIPALREQRSGHVFNIASIGGYTGAFSGWGIYCATKFALAGLTESLSEDLQAFGVKVTLVYPGYFRTNFLNKDALARPAHPIAAYEAARASERQHADTINGNQAGDPQKLAAALIATFSLQDPPLHLFLGSDAVSMAETKQAQVEQAIERHRALSVGTDYAKPV